MHQEALYVKLDMHGICNAQTLSGIQLFWVIVSSSRLNLFLYVIAIFILSDLHVDLSLVRFTLPDIS